MAGTSAQVLIDVYGRPRRRFPRRTRLAAAAILTGLVVSLAPGTPTRANPAEGGDPSPAVQQDQPVPVSPVGTVPMPDSRLSHRTPRAETAWPTAGEAVVELPSSGGGRGEARATGEPGSGSATPGGLPVTVRPPGGTDPGLAASVPGAVRVTVLAQAAASAADVSGVLLKVSRADGLTDAAEVGLDLTYTAFRHAYGGDFGGRLRLTSLPACALSTPEVDACKTQTPVLSSNDGAGVVSAASVEIPAAPAGAAGMSASLLDEEGGELLLAMSGSGGSGTGDFKATSLSAAYGWSAGNQAGDFTTGYPIPLPQVPGGLLPDITMGYSSGSVDGRTASSNNQPSIVGEGWDLPVGYIERTYLSCRDDSTPVDDLCVKDLWDVTMVFAGRSNRLVLADGTNHWRAEQDDGLRVERLTGSWSLNEVWSGEHWRVTTQDGTQYWFGTSPESTQDAPVFSNQSNEPCWTGTVSTSHCGMGYRWNLHRIVDPRGNVVVYNWVEHRNNYNRYNTVADDYTRTAVLSTIDYGIHPDASNVVGARVYLYYAFRCAQSTSTEVQWPAVCNTDLSENQWPDTPWDQNCGLTATTCPGRPAPTFWMSDRLWGVATQVRNPTSGVLETVDQWNLKHVFPGTFEVGSSPALWLDHISHTGYTGGTLAGLTTSFGGVRLPNRVDPGTGPSLNKYRISDLVNGAGGTTNVSYHGAQCSPTNLPALQTHNSMRCFRQWFDNGGVGTWGWFHKYTVQTVSENDHTGGGPAEYWNYFYSTAGSSTSVLWHYDRNVSTPTARRGWTHWAGYSAVTVWHGDPAGTLEVTDRSYRRGMHGDADGGAGRTVHVTNHHTGVQDVLDEWHLRGFLASESQRTGTGGAPTIAQIIHDPVTVETGSRFAHALKAKLVRTGVTSTGRLLAHNSTWRWAESRTTFDSGTDNGYHGVPVQVHDLGDRAVNDDDTCAKTVYYPNTSAWMVSYPGKIESFALGCDVATAGDVVTRATNYYDGAGSATTPPTEGLVTKVDRLGGAFGGGGTTYTESTAVYDAHGRVTQARDALNRLTTTAYTPTVGGPVTQTVVTNPAGHASTSTLNWRRGVPTQIVDANTKQTTVEYDPLGRLVKVWLPGRSTGLTPNVEYAYTLRDNGANVIRTRKLGPTGTQITSYELFDGRFRPRQSQTLSPDGKRAITDALYDARGHVARETAFYNNASAPTDTLVTAATATLPHVREHVYDGAGRETASILKSLGVEQWRTTYGYDGDRSTVDHPTGGTDTTNLVNVRGKAVELRQHHGSTPTGTFDATTYLYNPLGLLTRVTDPAGNRWEHTYDRTNRLVTTVDPDAGTLQRGYDNAGQLTTTMDGRGEVLALVYDSLGRVVERRDDTPTGTLRASWVFDTVMLGHPTSATRHSGGNSYTTAVTSYDDGYRPLGTTVTIPAAEGLLQGAYAFSATYNVDGSVATTTQPAAGGLSAETITNTYTAAGLPTSAVGASTYLASMQYLWDSTPSQSTHGSGANRLRLTSTVDSATRRLTKAETHTEHPGTPDTWDEKLTQHYGYTPAGTVASLRESAAGTTVSNECYGYDYLTRLTEAWTTTATTCQASPSLGVVGGPDPYWQSWTYNTTGSRLTQVAHAAGGDTTTTYTVPTGGASVVRPHRLDSTSTSGPGGSSGTSYAYDNSGNTTGRTVGGVSQTLAWDAEGLLTSVTASATVSSYLYDADGGRLISRDPGVNTLYLGSMELALDTATSTVTATRYYGNAVRTTSGGLTWMVGDHHGTGQLAITATSLTTQRRKSLPFGESRGTPPGSWPDNKGFLSATADPTGLTHLGAREYDPTIGRFVSIDPLINSEEPQQMHGYAYGHNNPVSKSDPSGLDPCIHGGGGCHYDGTDPLETRLPPEVTPPTSQSSTNAAESYTSHLNRVKGQLVRERMRNPNTETGRVCKSNPGRCASLEKDLDRGVDPDEVEISIICGGLVQEACRTWFGLDPNPTIPVIDLPEAADEAVDMALEALITRGRAPRSRGVDIGSRGRKATKHCSFSGDTLVLMADGSRRPIEDIVPGDTVRASDPESGDSGSREVSDLWVHDDDLYTLDTTAGTITTTEDHPFWNETDRQWQRADQIDSSDELLDADGRTVSVTGIRADTHHRAPAYNLTVVDIHTYYVLAGNTPILVHNTDPFCGKPFGKNTPGDADFHGSGYSLDEVLEFIYGHTGGGSPGMGRPNRGEIEATLRSAGPVRIEGQNAARLEYRGVRVIINYDMPWRSTAYYPGR